MTAGDFYSNQQHCRDYDGGKGKFGHRTSSVTGPFGEAATGLGTKSAQVPGSEAALPRTARRVLTCGQEHPWESLPLFRASAWRGSRSRGKSCPNRHPHAQIESSTCKYVPFLGIIVTMIEREISDRLTALFKQYPFVTVTGPRQSGKTTLCRSAFPNLEYANLEAPDQREFAESDPRGFLKQLGEGAIIDEVQHVPALLSYLQVFADEQGRNSLFVLSGSEQFRLSNAISQSLAGRTALLRLLPFSLRERRRTGASEAIDDIIFSGFYPRILDQGLDPRQALGDYFETYVERDVRRLGEIRNLSSFRLFVRLCAGRVGQLVNLSSLGSDAGVSHTTAREWLTVLETSYIIFQLPPFHANMRKRLVKSPKFYFYDVGLASYLIGIENAEQVATHPLRGALFENVVVAEALKHRFNRGRQSNVSFFRDSKGLECDLLYETGRGISAIEVKSGSTVSSDYFGSLNRVAKLIPNISAKSVVYGGTARQTRNDCDVVPLADLGGVLERFEVNQGIATFVREKSGPAPDRLRCQDAGCRLSGAYPADTRRSWSLLVGLLGRDSFVPFNASLIRHMAAMKGGRAPASFSRPGTGSGRNE